MSKKIPRPIEQEFPLDRWDPDDKVVIRQATQAAHERRSMLFAEVTRVYRDAAAAGVQEIKQSISPQEVRRIEVQLTLQACTLRDEDDKSLFRFRTTETGRQVLDMTEAEFAEAWGRLPPEVAAEIHEKVIAINPMWGPGGE